MGNDGKDGVLVGDVDANDGGHEDRRLPISKDITRSIS